MGCSCRSDLVRHHQIRQKLLTGIRGVRGGFYSLTEVVRIHDIRDAQQVHNFGTRLGSCQFVKERRRTVGIRVIRGVKAVLFLVAVDRHGEQGQLSLHPAAHLLLLHTRQQVNYHAGKDGDDRDDHHEFDQREPFRSDSAFRTMFHNRCLKPGSRSRNSPSMRSLSHCFIMLW